MKDIMKDIVEIYCHIDDYCSANDTQIKTQLIEYKQSKKTRNRSSSISVSEIITILVLFHQLRYRELSTESLNRITLINPNSV